MQILRIISNEATAVFAVHIPHLPPR